MLWGGIVLAAIGLTCWVIGIKSVIGWDRVQLSDVSRKDEEWFKGEYDVIAMNRFLGKTVWLPSAVFTSVYAILFSLERPIGPSPVSISVFVITLITLGGLITYGFIRARGDRFKR